MTTGALPARNPRLPLVLLLALGLSSASLFADVRFDFDGDLNSGSNSGPTHADWITTDLMGGQGSGVTLTATGFTGGRNRGTAATPQGGDNNNVQVPVGTHAAMYQDVAFTAASSVTLSLSGLDPNAIHQVTIFSYDSAQASTTSTLWGPPGDVTHLSSFIGDQGGGGSVGPDPDTDALSSYATTFSITSDGSGNASIIGNLQTNLIMINGLTIDPGNSGGGNVLQYTDANAGNTSAVGGTPNPFSITTASSGNLWRERSGFGFDVNGNTEIFEKDAGAFGDAAMLQTVVSGLNSGQEYGVYVCFLSPNFNSWQVQAGLDTGNLITFTRSGPDDRITDLGLTQVSGSNRNQYLGLVGNITADSSGEIILYVDDGEATSDTSRTWYEGVAVGAPAVIPEPPELPEGVTELAANGVWTWFNDERAIWHLGKLYTGYVLSDGRYGVTQYDPVAHAVAHSIISTSTSRETDDHNNPSFTVLPDDRLLITYSKHSTNKDFYQRTSLVTEPDELSDWGPEIVKSPDNSSIRNNTYANTYRLPAESDRIYMFHRFLNFNPTISITDDLGSNWDAPIQMIATGQNNVRPYPQYTSNGSDRIDMIYTDGHPRNENNSVYHLYYQGGNLSESDGTLLSSLAGLPLDHDSGERGQLVYSYSNSAWGPGDGPDDWIPSGRAWTWDIQYDANGHPICVFQVQVDSVTGNGWNHDRIYYYYARWTGSSWQKRFIAHGGRGIYAVEDDYGGGISIDPESPNVVYLSSNAAAPFSIGDIQNVPLGPNERYEIYRGVTEDGGLTFSWEAITADSDADNLRPIVPVGHDYEKHAVWFHGRYTTYTDFNAAVVGIFEPFPSSFRITDFIIEDGMLSMSWNSEPDTSYRVMAATDLSGDFPTVVADSVDSQGTTTSIMVPSPPLFDGQSRGFVRVEVE